MTEFLLRQLGATAEQVDRERARIRSEFFGGSPDGELLPEDRAWPASEGTMRLTEMRSRRERTGSMFADTNRIGNAMDRSVTLRTSVPSPPESASEGVARGKDATDPR